MENRDINIKGSVIFMTQGNEHLNVARNKIQSLSFQQCLRTVQLKARLTASVCYSGKD